jgi:sulfonate transport system substrate-binding protein
MTSYFNIGGVPEHFNIPFRKAIDEGVFSTRNIELIWKDYRGGTGDLIKAIKEKQIDIGVVLTEGAVKAIADGAPMKIVQVYVNSPLYWGIYCGNQSPFTRLNEVENPSFCISRFGSGSHLMAYLLCQQQGWTMDKVEFVEVGSFSGALKEFNHNPDRLFLWERFMTKPYLDSGTLKKNWRNSNSMGFF